jgi:quercetin dioxygenase-like cupin family protein
MTAHPLRDFEPVPTRPGTRARNLIATEHGITSFFLSELRMEEGASVPLHTHPIEEAWVVTDGALTVRIGDETVVAQAESVVRIPPGVPHAVRNNGRAEARALAGAPWNRATFFTEATTYLEGTPRE